MPIKKNYICDLNVFTVPFKVISLCSSAGFHWSCNPPNWVLPSWTSEWTSAGIMAHNSVIEKKRHYCDWFDSSLSIITLCMAVLLFVFFHELNHRCYEPAKCCPVMLTCWECKNSTECCSAECQSENLLEQTVFLLFCMSLWWVSASESLGIS